MNPISPISQISKLLQKAVAKNKRTGTTHSKTSKGEGSDDSSTPSLASKAILKKDIVAGLHKLPYQDRFSSQGISVLVTNILNWSFEKHAIQDIKIQSVVEEVTQTILDQPQIKDGAQSLLKALLSEYENKNAQKQE